MDVVAEPASGRSGGQAGGRAEGQGDRGGPARTSVKKERPLDQGSRIRMFLSLTEAPL